MLADEYGTASNIKSRVNRLMPHNSFANLNCTRFICSCINIMFPGCQCWVQSLLCNTGWSSTPRYNHQRVLVCVLESLLYRNAFLNLLIRCRQTDWSSTVAPSSLTRGRRRRSPSSEWFDDTFPIFYIFLFFRWTLTLNLSNQSTLLSTFVTTSFIQVSWNSFGMCAFTFGCFLIVLL